MGKPEILAPAGNLFKLQTAVRYGADAVYIGGRKFGLRSAADNFTPAQIEQGCRFAHAHGAKVYVVLNAFLFDKELAQLPPFLARLEQARVDAVIISDLGVINQVKHHSRLNIHLSTQASTLNSYSAKLMADMGVKRIVLGREVALAEAKRIKQAAGLEVEVFGHGAMCMAYSGNCTISNYTAGRDSNRGGCIQSCRFKYRMSQNRDQVGPWGHFLSSKDLQAVQQLPAFVENGIDSLKIEGRMKSPLYVATTVRAYKAARDRACKSQQPQTVADLIDELNTMSHRDYTQANLMNKAGADSIYHQDRPEQIPSHDLLGRVVEKGSDYIAVYLSNALSKGEPAEMLTLDGGVVQLDTSRPRAVTGLDVERVKPHRVVLLPPHPLAENHLLLRKPKHVEADHLTAAPL